MEIVKFDSKISWVVAIASACMNLLILIPMKVSGLIFVEILDRYHVGRNLAGYPTFTITLMRCTTEEGSQKLENNTPLKGTLQRSEMLQSQTLWTPPQMFVSNIISLIVAMSIKLSTAETTWNQGINCHEKIPERCNGSTSTIGPSHNKMSQNLKE
ncbi:hypothetical protein HNY73_003184 [Argiope bruennichi]|uniref:Uncharacterized protein n=1 Tax=Argiope bruennichi TaxID=94029 RepID=A0A8T0G061_ARGBR|nr:hypothetical protein HNY73_003184 [Argiope bruennichi]